MSVMQSQQIFDSGANHLKPALVAVAIAVLMTVVVVVFTGLPH